MKSSFPELTFTEKCAIKDKARGKKMNETLQKLQDQFWQALKEGDLARADKCSKIFWYIKENERLIFPL